MYFVDPYAEMRLYKVKQERLAQRLELLRVLGVQTQSGSPVTRLMQSLAMAARRIRGGSFRVTPAPTPLSQHRDTAAACRDELAA
jgi:hypothetical protein